MDAFIVANPALIKWVGGMLLSFIGILIAAILFFVKRYLDDTSTTIKSFGQALDIIKADIGFIKDRLQRQETTCEMQREHCRERQMLPPPPAWVWSHPGPYSVPASSDTGETPQGG